MEARSEVVGCRIVTIAQFSVPVLLNQFLVESGESQLEAVFDDPVFKPYVGIPDANNQRLIHGLQRFSWFAHLHSLFYLRAFELGTAWIVVKIDRARGFGLGLWSSALGGNIPVVGVEAVFGGVVVSAQEVIIGWWGDTGRVSGFGEVQPVTDGFSSISRVAKLVTTLFALPKRVAREYPFQQRLHCTPVPRNSDFLEKQESR